MSEEWASKGWLSPSPQQRKPVWKKWLHLQLVVLGPAGTGKTAVLKVAEALIQHFLGADAVAKCALSNTAARLFGGDTAHSWWSLRSESMRGSKRFLSGHVLKRQRKRWQSKAA
eukprot:2036387-Karenia_brevis.AAC.1